MWWPNVSASIAVTMYMSLGLPCADRRWSMNAFPSMSWNEILLLSTSSRKTVAALRPSFDATSYTWLVGHGAGQPTPLMITHSCPRSSIESRNERS